MDHRTAGGFGPFQTKMLQPRPDAVAPDGSEVRLLLRVTGGSVAHFELAPGMTSVAVSHRTVDEVWYVLKGRGEMWRKLFEQEEVVELSSGVCLTIPVGTRFQFRAFGSEPLAAVGMTIPSWPGAGEARIVPGRWNPTVQAGPVT
jgi:mannose-6-phosphate isomerase-like protein (cupin superfamily)